jgi:hypothetical protein
MEYSRGENSTKFLIYLKKKKNYKNEEDYINNGKGDELICMTYLKSMDNYFDVDDAIRYSGYSLIKNSKSFTYQIITALIKSQQMMSSDRCQVYKIADEVRNNTSLIKDMKDESIAIIFAYMDKYKHNCLDFTN